jgi:hypothetical protein
MTQPSLEKAQQLEKTVRERLNEDQTKILDELLELLRSLGKTGNKFGAAMAMAIVSAEFLSDPEVLTKMEKV